MLVYVEKFDPYSPLLHAKYFQHGYVENRIRSKATYKDLRRSVEVHGIREPIICDYRPGRNPAPMCIQVGNQRLSAARDLKIPTVRAVVWTYKDADMPAQHYDYELHSLAQALALFTDPTCPSANYIANRVGRGLIHIREQERRDP